MFFVFTPSPKEEDYASSMTCPEPSCKSEKVHILKWRGFFSSMQAKRLLGLFLRLHPDATETTDSAWLNLTFHGFDELQTGLILILLLTTLEVRITSFFFIICSTKYLVRFYNDYGYMPRLYKPKI